MTENLGEGAAGSLIPNLRRRVLSMRSQADQLPGQDRQGLVLTIIASSMTKHAFELLASRVAAEFWTLKAATTLNNYFHPVTAAWTSLGDGNVGKGAGSSRWSFSARQHQPDSSISP